MAGNHSQIQRSNEHVIERGKARLTSALLILSSRLLHPAFEFGIFRLSLGQETISAQNTRSGSSGRKICCTERKSSGFASFPHNSTHDNWKLQPLLLMLLTPDVDTTHSTQGISTDTMILSLALFDTPGSKRVT